jgi:hypothetical protein
MKKAATAQFVADKVQKTDAASIAMIKNFIDRRYEMMWDSALWRETLATTTYTITVDTEEVTLNATVDLPVSARWNDMEIVPMDYQSVFQIDPTLFNDAGSVTNFLVLPRDASGNAMIKLLRKPDKEKSLLVLGKQKITSDGNTWTTSSSTDTDVLPILSDDGEPKINGIDNALLSFVEGDILEHMRQYGKAQVKYQEAGNHLAVARDMDNHQSGRITRIVPQVESFWSVGDFE